MAEYIWNGPNNDEWKTDKKEEYYNDEPCCWCNDQGPKTEDGESHPCAFCGAMS